MSLITLNDVKTELNLTESDTDYDTLINAIREAAQGMFEEMTDRKFESQEFTEYYNGKENQFKVLLRNYPIISITSIYDDSDWVYGSDTLIDSSDYNYDSETGIVYIDGGLFKGFNNIKVVYKAGYGTSTLPKAIREVWIRQACQWFKDAKDSGWAMSSVSTGIGSTTKKTLKDNLLPDFVLIAELNRSIR